MEKIIPTSGYCAECGHYTTDVDKHVCIDDATVFLDIANTLENILEMLESIKKRLGNIG